MALKIFGTDPETQPKPRQSFANDVVGRFRSGYVLNKRPAALNDWRVTTGDPEVADKVHDLLGGDAPQEWDATGEDNLEVFTASPSINIVLDGSKALRQRMVLWGRSGKPIHVSDGEWILDERGNPTDKPDPDAHLSFQERKANKETGAVPDIEVFFRLEDEYDLGIFKFKTGSWSMASDLAYFGIEDELADYDGPVRATLTLEEVTFVAKNGARAGQTVQYTKPVLKIVGAYEAAA